MLMHIHTILYCVIEYILCNINVEAIKRRSGVALCMYIKHLRDKNHFEI